ncbi:MAG: hypothetical protein GY940_02080 [bacterium]|nr:hypothetical protein [bacterium]
MNVKDIDEFIIKDKNIVSFKRVSAEIPLSSLFSKEKEVNLSIHQPKVVLDDTLLKSLKKKTKSKKSPFKINKVNIIDGEIVFDTGKYYVNLVKFNLLSFPRENATIYRLTSPHLKAIFPQSRKQVVMEGQLYCEFRELPNSWKVSKFYWETQHVNIDINGRVFKNGLMAFNVYTQGSFRQLLDPILGKKMSVREFMYSNSRIRKSKSGIVTLEGNFNTNACTFGGEELKNLQGAISWDNRGKRLRVRTTFDAGGVKASLDLVKRGRPIDVTVRNIPVPVVTRITAITGIIPLGGMVKEGRVDILGRQFDGTMELVRQPETDPDTFNVEGKVEFSYNGKTKNASFSAQGLKTEFGTLSAIEGKVTPKARTRLRLNFTAQPDKLQFLDKYTKYYIKLPLVQWKLVGGNSSISLNLERIKNDYFIESDVHFRNFDSSGQRVESMKGHISTKGPLTRGTFRLKDKDLTGGAAFTLNTKESDLEIKFNNIKGQAKKVLGLLDIDLQLHGGMTGDFTYTDRKGMTVPLVKGRFEAPRINFYEFIFDDFKGKLEYSTAITLKDLAFRYMDGKGNGDIVIDYGREWFDVDGKIEDIDLSRLNSEFTGKGSVFFNGTGGFEKDPIRMNYRTGDIHFYKDQSFKMTGEGAILTDFSRYGLQTGGTITNGATSSPFTFGLNQEEGRYNGSFSSTIKDINMLIPWGDNKGEVTVTGTLKGTSDTELSVEGHADFKGEVLSFPNFPHALDNFSGDLTFKGLDFTLRNLQGSMGGGGVRGNGFLTVKDNALDSLFLAMNGQDMTLYPMDRTSCTMDADMTINYIKERKKLLLAGTMNIHSALWEREIEESITFNTNPSLSASGSIIMEMLEYDLRLVGSENMRVNNNFGTVTGKFDLRITGNVDFPVMLGTIESREGTINFSGKKFELVKAKFSFNDKFRNDPQIKIESEAFIKNYRIRFNINGPSSRMKPELLSSPPLPTRDILSLISVGELFQRPTSTELSTQIGAGTTGLIASELTEQIKKRTKKIFGNYMLRLDPNISSITGSSFLDSSRIIVGKEVSKDFLIVYSTNISTRDPQMVYYLQYRVSPSLSLIGMRNDKEDSFSIELRFRKRH